MLIQIWLMHHLRGLVYHTDAETLTLLRRAQEMGCAMPAATIEIDVSCVFLPNMFVFTPFRNVA